MWPTAVLGRHAVSGGGPSDGGRCRRDSRHARRGKEEGKDDRGLKGIIELSGTFLKTRVI
jgi:hypothetical protein